MGREQPTQSQSQMSYTVEQLVAVNPYNPDILPDLENYVNEQVSSQTYSLEANLCLLRLYQFEPERMSTQIVARILIKALMAMPAPDFSLCLFLIPERVQMDEQFKTLIVLSHYLETAKFRQFWDEAAGFIEEFKSRNFSIYAQWAGILSIPFLFLAGGLAFLTFVVFAIIAWILAFILIFIEVPFCLKICPTSQNFDAFIRIFENNLIRTIGYLAFSVVIFIFVTKSAFYVMPGLSLAIAGICYGIAALKHQNHVSSKLTGGTGV